MCSAQEALSRQKVMIRRIAGRAGVMRRSASHSHSNLPAGSRFYASAARSVATATVSNSRLLLRVSPPHSAHPSSSLRRFSLASSTSPGVLAFDRLGLQLARHGLQAVVHGGARPARRRHEPVTALHELEGEQGVGGEVLAAAQHQHAPAVEQVRRAALLQQEAPL